MVHTYHPRTWYSDSLAGPAAASPDGRYLLYPCEGIVYLRDSDTGETTTLADRIGWNEVQWAQWQAIGHRVLMGGETGEGRRRRGVFDLDLNELTDSGLPSSLRDILYTTSEQKRIVAGRFGARGGLWLYDDERSEPLFLAEHANKLGWAVVPDASRMAYLVQNEAGWCDLYVVDLADGSRRALAKDLDAAYQPTPLAWSSDGSEIYVSLVGIERGTAASKQDPLSSRDLDIFAVDCESGEMRAIVERSGDDLISGVVGDRLLWTNFETRMGVGVVDLEAHGTKQVTPISNLTSSYPFWHPDGDRISMMFGAFHIADWALNWDSGVVRVDERGAPLGELESVIAGPHEDFGLSWSPDGRWMAFHSHRSPGPAMGYNGWGATDDIFLRAASGGEDIKLSKNVGFEVCQPDWSPDGFEVIFIAVHPSGGRYRPVRIEIDPDTGQPVAQSEFTVPGIDADIIAATFSQVGPEIALEERVPDGTHRLWIVEGDGRGKRLLAEFRALSEISGIDFTPDGDHVVYSALAGDHHQLFRVRTDGSRAPEQLTDVDTELYVPQVSPNGRLVAVTTFAHTKTVLSLTVRP